MRYTTIQGDTWDAIAYKVYGNSYQVTALMAANPRQLNIAVFPSGIELVVPDLPETTTSDVPPWRRP